MSQLWMTFVTAQAFSSGLYWISKVVVPDIARGFRRVSWFWQTFQTVYCLLTHRWTVSDLDKKIRILIVDRHEAVRRALRIRLSSPAQLEVVGVASEPDEALELVSISKPDVVLFGLQNGTDEDLFQTAIAVRNLVKLAPTVILLAPYVDSIERELLLQAGAKRYLLKHINSYSLIQEIELAASYKPFV